MLVIYEDEGSRHQKAIRVAKSGRSRAGQIVRLLRAGRGSHGAADVHRRPTVPLPLRKAS